MKNKLNQKGQAVIAILFIMVISISIITSIIMIVFNNVKAGSDLEQGAIAFYSAEAGAQNGLLRLLRDPTYTGETMAINDGTVIIQVSGGVITSTAQVYNSIRKVQVQTVYNNNVLTVISWKEIN